MRSHMLPSRPFLHQHCRLGLRNVLTRGTRAPDVCGENVCGVNNCEHLRKPRPWRRQRHDSVAAGAGHDRRLNGPKRSRLENSASIQR